MQQPLVDKSESWRLILIGLLLCFAIGAVRVCKLAMAILSSYWLRPRDLNKRYGGGWAIVTGGSQGIGLAIAEQLAKHNFNLVLASRSVQKLQNAKDKILKQHPQIQVQYVSVDFAAITTPQQYQKVFKEVLSKDISVLVNNVGYHLPHKFLDNSFEQIRKQLKINILPITYLSQILSKNMLKRNTRSAIINLSSSASLTSFVGCSNYSATKTYDDFISRCMDLQLAHKIDILNVKPFLVTTPMTQNISAFSFVQAKSTAQEIMRKLGRSKVCYGPLFHRIEGAFSVFADSQTILAPIYSSQFRNVQKMYDQKKKS